MYLTDIETASKLFYTQGLQFLWKKCVVHAPMDSSGRDDNGKAINNGFLCGS